jgi:pyruvate formate lyase activating enzyme
VPCKAILTEAEFFVRLQKLKKLVDGVVITGGEPLMHASLEGFIKKIKAEGLKIKIDTNGLASDTLWELFKQKLVDYVALDVKAPPGLYQEVTNSQVDVDWICGTIADIKRSGVRYEFRTTVLPFYTERDFVDIMAMGVQGADNYVLQQFKPLKCLDKNYQTLVPLSETRLKELAHFVEPYVKKVTIRNI